MDSPTVGRIVHFTSHGSPVQPDGTQVYPSVKRAAIITEVVSEGLNLMVCNPEGIFFKQNVVQGDEPGQWNWPTRV